MEKEKFSKINVVTKQEDSIYFAIAKELKEEDPDYLDGNFITTNSIYRIEIKNDESK